MHEHVCVNAHVWQQLLRLMCMLSMALHIMLSMAAGEMIAADRGSTAAPHRCHVAVPQFAVEILGYADVAAGCNLLPKLSFSHMIAFC